MEKSYDLTFDVASSNRPYMVYPNVFSDNRGSFSEVLVGDDIKNIKQINRSTSCKWTIRGCHAQKSPHCQSKLVEALNHPIYDIITDARPDSRSFGLTEAYLLDPKKQNKLFVPHGFLHAFAVPEYVEANEAIFMYYCDDVYSKQDEICVNPMSIFPKLVEAWSKTVYNDNHILFNFIKMFKDPKNLILSDKDLKGQIYQDFMNDVSKEYHKTGKLWYKSRPEKLSI